MPISAPGTWTSNPQRRHAGFTLIEILVVLVIIGIMIAGITLSGRLGGGGDRELQKMRDGILAVTDYLRDQAALQNREYGMRCFVGGYQFLVFDARANLWQPLQGDTVTATRTLPPGFEMTLLVEGRQVVLPQAEVKPDALAPQIILYSSGELNLFELTLQREGGAGVRIAPSENSDRIDAVDLEAHPA